MRDSSGLTPTEYRYTGQLEHSYIKLYWYRSRWYDGELAHFIQADTIVPKAGNTTAFNRYAYVEWNPTNKCDPSGHCSFSSSSLLMPWGVFMFYAGCAQDLKDAYDTYQAGERRLGALYLEATGLKDLAVSTAERVQDLNSDKDTVFSDAPLNERALPSIRLGTWAVSTAANIVGTAQIIRAELAFSRSGVGGSDYFVKDTLTEKTFGPGDELYRVYDGASSSQKGYWAFTEKPGNQITAIRKGALPTGNNANFMTKMTFNAPVTAEVSQVAPLYQQPGGAVQVKLPYPHENVSFSPGERLPIGLMPFIPQRPFATLFERLK